MDIHDQLCCDSNCYGMLLQYFIQTCENVEGAFSTLKWLESIDEETLTYILEAGEQFQKEDDRENDEELMEFVLLALYLSAKEKDIDILDEDKIHIYSEHNKNSYEHVLSLFLMASYELLRRKKVVDIIGDGILNNFHKGKTEIKLKEKF